MDFGSDPKNSNRTTLGGSPDVVVPLSSAPNVPAIDVTPAPEDPAVEFADDSDSEFGDRSDNDSNFLCADDEEPSEFFPSQVGGSNSDGRSLAAGSNSDGRSLVGGSNSDGRSLAAGSNSDVRSLVGGSNSDARSLICALCCKEILNEPVNIINHLRLHGDSQPYKCAYCGFAANFEADVKSHCGSEHFGKPAKVHYNHQQEKSYLSQLQAKCFPLVNSVQSQKSQNPQNLLKPTPVMHGNQNGAGRGLLRKLCCAICLQTIADNPKSIGIHVNFILIKFSYNLAYHISLRF